MSQVLKQLEGTGVAMKENRMFDIGDWVYRNDVDETDGSEEDQIKKLFAANMLEKEKAYLVTGIYADNSLRLLDLYLPVNEEFVWTATGRMISDAKKAFRDLNPK
jgi:hypothetical protein